MADMADAVNPANIPEGVAAVAGYIDGPQSEWPADAWARFTQPTMRGSVFGNPAAEWFDVEPGNASASAVGVALRARTNQGQPSVIYVDKTTVGAVTTKLGELGLPWLPPSAWPHPGPYLWAADWSVEVGTVPDWCPVAPVAVQDRHATGVDLSTLHTGWLPEAVAPVPEPGPAPAPEPIHLPTGATMHAENITVATAATGRGWAPLPVPAAKVVSYEVQTTNPDKDGAYSAPPDYLQLASEPGPNSPNGALVAHGPGGGTWGITLWVLT